MGFGLFNYRWVFSAGKFLQSAVARGKSTPQPGGPVIRTFQPSPQGVPSVWNDASEPQQRKVELWARNFREFCRKWRLTRHFWVLLHAVNLRHGTDGFTSPPKEGALIILSPEKSDGFGRVPKTSTLTSRPPKPLYLITLTNNCLDRLQDLCSNICTLAAQSWFPYLMERFYHNFTRSVWDLRQAT